MKLLRLEMQAVGPFVGREIVDFGALADQPLVLIHGPTGAGKTTILDAITFALYGTSSGEARRADDLRCDRAPGDVLTEVVLDFRLGTRTLRVRRIPSQRRPRRRGKGLVEQDHEATLFDRGALAEGDASDGTLQARGPTAVDAALGVALGFDEAQFRHVLMLPQGQFREFLEASSSDRERILARLFDTHRFSHVTEELGAARVAVRAEQHEVDAHARALLAEVGAGGEDELAASVVTLEAEEAAWRQRLPELADERERARRAAEEARAELGKLEERDEATRRRDMVERRRAEVGRLRERLAAARHAAPLVELGRHAEARAHEAATAAAQAERDREAAQATADAAVAAREAATRAKAQEPELEALRRRLAELERLRGVADAFEAAGRELTAAELEHATISARVEEARRRQAAKASERDAETELDRRREKEASELEELERGLRELVDQRERHRELSALDRDDEELRARIRDQGVPIAEAVRVEEALERRFEARDRDWRAGQAGALARELQAGAACPVCGSTTHPAPAIAGDELPSARELEELRARVKEARERTSALEAARVDAREEVARVEARRDEVRRALGELAEVDGEVLVQRVADAERRCALARRARDARRESAAAVAAAEQAVADTEVEAKALDELLRRVELRRSEARGGVAARAADLPEELREPGQLAAQVDATREAARRVDDELDRSRSALVIAETSAAKGAAAAEGSSEVAARTRLRADEAQRELAEARRRVGLDDDRAWRSAIADAERVDELDAEVGAWERELEAARDRLARASEAADGIVARDVVALDAARDQALAEHDAAVASSVAASRLLEAHRSALARYREQRVRGQELAAREALVSTLAAVAGGEAGLDNGTRISFHRYVLAAYFAEVVGSASRRLEEMSEGRYLLRASVAAGDRRVAAGLDLEIIDGYSGRARPVRTLSGGEGFLTSLALALGLADVATAHAGGIHLDTLFIDEGFGTLDADALDKALEVLVSLHRGGRMVALISHVPELERRIAARITVTKTPQGSRLRVVAPRAQVASGS